MKWTTATALLLASGAAAAAGAAVLRGQPDDPRAVLESVREGMESSRFDRGVAVRRLGRALDGVLGADDPGPLAAELLELRADVYLELGAYGDARADMEHLLATFRRDDRALERRIAEVQVLEGHADEAQRRVERLLAEDPDDGDAWRIVGQLEASRSEDALATAASIAESTLSRAGARRAAELARVLASRREDDPARGEAVLALRGLFLPHDGEALDRLLRASDDARAAFDRARTALARALDGGATPEAVVALVRIYAAAGRDEEAADLALAARSVPEIATSPRAASELFSRLAAVDRFELVRNLAGRWDWRYGGDLAFYADMARLLYEAGELGPLGRAAQGLLRTGGTIGKDWYAFYSGANSLFVARNADDEETRVRAATNAASRLRRFALDEESESPFLGAKDEAWFLCAEAYRLAGDRPAERETLQAALRAVPDRGAEPWLRSAELLQDARNVNWRAVEQRVTHAMSLDPTRAAALVPAWLEAGDGALATDGVDFEDVLEEVRISADGTPLRDVGPSVMYRVGLSHVREGRAIAAVPIARSLLRRYEDLLPALDLLIEAELAHGGSFEVSKDVLYRIQLVGADATSERFYEAVGADAFDAEDTLALVRAAPARFGKPLVARRLLAEGRAKEAARVLADLPDSVVAADLRLLRAEARAEAGDWEGASEDLEALVGHPRLGARALAASIDARIGTGRVEEMDGVLERLLSAGASAALLVDVVDRLAEGALLEEALDVLVALDAQPSTRTPAFYRRLVRLAVVRGEPEAAAEIVERADAYVEDGTPELGAVLLAVDARDWRRLPLLVGRLRSSGFEPTPAQDAALALLEERLEAGRRAAERGLAEAPRSPRWAFTLAAADALVDQAIDLPEWFGEGAEADVVATLRGGRSGRRDPREALAVLLAVDTPGFALWAEPRVVELLQGGGGGRWPAWLEHEALRALGRDGLAAESLERLLDEHPDFGPGWDLHVAAAERAAGADPFAREVLRARIDRAVTLGSGVLADPVEVAVAQAGGRALADRWEEAAEQLSDALESEQRDDSLARHLLGRLWTEAGRHGLAVEHLERAAEDPDVAHPAALVDDLVRALERASDAGVPARARIAPERLEPALDRLVERFPRDPLAALASARLRPAPEGTGHGAFVARARHVLDGLRRRTGGRALEELRPGAAKAWTRWLLEHAPASAQALVEHEILRTPGEIELWVRLAEVLAERGLERDARDLYRVTLEILPLPEAGHAYGILAVKSGADADEVEPYLRAADAALGRSGSHASAWVRANLGLRRTPDSPPGALRGLERLWDRRVSLAAPPEPLELGLVYVSALLRSEEPGALATAGVVLDELEPYAAGDPPSADLVRAYRGLLASIQSDA